MSKVLKLPLAGALLLVASVTAAQAPDPQTPATDKTLRYEDSASVEAKAPPVPPPSDTATKL